MVDIVSVSYPPVSLIPQSMVLQYIQYILHYHIIDRSHPAESLVSGNLSTLSGDTVSAVVSDVAISFNNAYVIERDWMFDNGIIHVIDRVLLPPSDPLPAKLTKFNDFPTEVHRT